MHSESSSFGFAARRRAAERVGSMIWSRDPLASRIPDQLGIRSSIPVIKFAEPSRCRDSGQRVDSSFLNMLKQGLSRSGTTLGSKGHDELETSRAGGSQSVRRRNVSERSEYEMAGGTETTGIGSRQKEGGLARGSG